MKDLRHFEIAGVGFSTSCPRKQDLQEPVLGYPSEFKSVRVDRLIGDIDIRLAFVKHPKQLGITKLCDSGQTWTMFRDHEGYVLSFDLDRNGVAPLWLARFNQDCTQVTVHCNEKFMVEKDGRTIRLNPVGYPLDQILLMYHLARKDGAILHAAGVEIQGKGFIFPGKSGAGKSTLVRQLGTWEDIQILSDDRIVVRKMNNTYKAFGTPWPGEAGIARNAGMSLYGIIFILQGKRDRIERINPQEALAKLMPVASIPWYDKEIMPHVLAFCEELVSNIPAFELEFYPSSEVAEYLEGFSKEFF